ncbi:MAG: hypothetical protein ACT4PO_07670, partial [Actinomycetota bacterium]
GRYRSTVLGRAEWLVVDTGDPWIQRAPWIGWIQRRGSPPLEVDPTPIPEFMVRIRSDSRWKQVFAQEGVFVFRKVPLP